MGAEPAESSTLLSFLATHSSRRSAGAGRAVDTSLRRIRLDAAARSGGVRSSMTVAMRHMLSVMTGASVGGCSDTGDYYCQDDDR